MARPKAIEPLKRKKKHVNMLLYGEPGSGKSVFAGTSPNVLLLLNSDDEGSSAARWRRGFNTGSCDQWVVDDYDDATQAYEYVRHEGVKEYDWVWLDNVSLFQEQLMDQIMEDLIARNSTRNRFIPDKPQYLENQQRLSLLVRDFSKLPIHFGITAHVMEVEDDEGELQMLPDVQGGQGKISRKLCGYCNIVGYMKVTKEGREIRTNKAKGRIAKDRFHAFDGKLGPAPRTPEGYEGPTVPQMMAAIDKAMSGGPKKRPAKKRASATKKR